MSKVTVSKKILDWALDRSGLTLADIEGKFPRMRQWIDGQKQPTLRQLESLAKFTLTPLGFFFLKEPPEERLPVPYFRTLGDEASYSPSPDLLETIHTMQRRQAWLREFLVDQGQEALTFVRSARPDVPPASVGQRIRMAIHLDLGWAARQPSWTEALRVLREAIENAGILVVVNSVVGNNNYRKLDPDEFRGFVLMDDIAPLVFVNGADGRAAQMFTLAHELAHVFFGSSAAFDLREMSPANDPTEQACNRVAAEFLVPEQQIRRIWPSVRGDPERFQSIAREFKVSELVAARRALDIGLIAKNDFLMFYRDYLTDERRKAARRSEGGDFYATQNLRVGRRFALAVVRAAKEGKILYSEAYRLTGLYGKTFDGYSASLGFGGS
ncbi:MAG: ImmA/IrrE family metallo-endopeptidase [Planctomycetota bacterium]|nr:ImmA/IrrE family metallo-endopeptidase [Planctomycetota bacterium]